MNDIAYGPFKITQIEKKKISVRDLRNNKLVRLRYPVVFFFTLSCITAVGCVCGSFVFLHTVAQV